MMAVWVSSGALLLLLLTGASYSYPAKTGFDPGSYHGPHYGANPASAGSSWEVPSSGHAAVSSSGVSFPSNSAPAQPAELAEPRYPEPSAPEVTEEAPDTAEAYVAPVYAPSGPAPPANYQPAAEPDFTWAVPPPVFSEASSRPRPSSHRIVDNKPAPVEAPSNVSPPVYPLYQAGELSHREDTYEHGNYESETEEQGFLLQPPPPPPGPMVAASNAAPPPNMVGDWVRLPYPYNYMFLTGQYPPGTYTHQSSSLEHGHDYWQDTHYIRDYYPAQPVEVAPLPADVQEPQIVEPPVRQPAKQPMQGAGKQPVKQQQPIKRPPVQQPSQPQRPSRPVQQPSQPQRPSRPVQQPSQPQWPSRPVQQPSRPVQQPSQPVQQPSQPQWPSRPAKQPERSVGLGQTAMTGPKQPYRAASSPAGQHQRAFQY